MENPLYAEKNNNAKMTWFERYGIVGLYYVILSEVIIASGLNASILSADYFKTLLLAIGVASLPAGYLISIFSQNIYYYCLPESWQVHKTVCKDIPKFKKFKNFDEKRLETRLAIIQRLIIPKNEKIEQIRWFQEYATKRWDVLVISFSMIISTLLVWLTAVLGYIIIIILYRNIDFNHFIISIIIIIITFIFLIISFCSRKLMFDQIVEAAKCYFTYLTENKEEEIKRMSEILDKNK